MGLAIFFGISAWGYVTMHELGWAMVDGVIAMACIGGWGALSDRANDAHEEGD